MRSLVFCTTCRFSVEGATGPGGRAGGETRAAEAVLGAWPDAMRGHFIARMPPEGGARS